MSTAMQSKARNIIGDPYRSDMYSVGVMILQLCYLDIRINTVNLTQKDLITKATLITKMGYSIQLSGIIKKMIDANAFKRPDFKMLQKELKIPDIFKPILVDSSSLIAELE